MALTDEQFNRLKELLAKRREAELPTQTREVRELIPQVRAEIPGASDVEIRKEVTKRRD